MINTNNYLFFFQKKMKPEKDYGNLIGMELKMRRKSLNLTLSEASDGICCPSYLSKMENNQVPGNNNYVSELLNRLKRTDEEEVMDPDEYEKLILAAISGTYFLSGDLLDSIEEYASKFKLVFYSDLLVLIIALYRKELDKALEAILSIMAYRDSLEENQIPVFTVFLAEYEFLVHNYRDAFLLCESLEPFWVQNDKLFILRDITYLYTSYHLRNDYHIIRLYERVSSELNSVKNSKRLSKIKLDYVLYLANSKNVSEAYRIYKMDHELESPILTDYFRLKQGETSNLKKNLSLLEHNHEYYFLMALFNEEVGFLSDTKTLLEGIDIEELGGSFLMNEYLEYQKVKSSGNVVEIIHHLRDIVIERIINSNDLLVAPYYTLELMRWYGDTAHYKDGMLLINRIVKMEKKIEEADCLCCD